MVAERLKGTDVKVCTVVGFPLGAVSSEVKAFETKKAIEDGADEIDMVINVGALRIKITNTFLMTLKLSEMNALIKHSK